MNVICSYWYFMLVFGVCIAATMHYQSKLPRMIWWSWVTIILVGINVQYQPAHILNELLFKVCQVSVFAVLGYWIDRELADYARPFDFLKAFRDYAGSGEGTPPAAVSQAVFFAAMQGLFFIAAQFRRAFIIGLVIYAGCVGL